MGLTSICDLSLLVFCFNSPDTFEDGPIKIEERQTKDQPDMKIVTSKIKKNKTQKRNNPKK